LVYAAESDPLCYPGTTVLINLLEVRNQTELDEVELALFLTRADEPLPAGELDYLTTSVCIGICSRMYMAGPVRCAPSA